MEQNCLIHIIKFLKIKISAYFEIKLLLLNKGTHLYIRSISLTSSPRSCNRREGSIWMVKLSIICIEEEGCERFLREKRKKNQEFDPPEGSCLFPLKI